MVRIYRSPDPKVDPPKCSLFSFMFSRDHDPNGRALVEAATGQTFTRSDIRNLSLQLAWSLKNTLSLKREDTVALFSMNSVVWGIALFGTIAAGARVTTVSSLYTPSELLFQLQDSGAYYIFAHPALLKTTVEALKLAKVAESEIRKRIILAGPPASYAGIEKKWRRIDDLFGKGQLEKEEPVEGDRVHETAFICYSSGTTAKPKGIELTHYNLISVLIGMVYRAEYVNASTCALGIAPFFHIYGLASVLLLSFLLGCPLVILSHFDPEDFCANIERYRATAVAIVPPILIVLANHPAVDKYDVKSLDVLYCAAAPLGKDLILTVRARLAKRGADVHILQAWGLTETSPAITMGRKQGWLDRIGSVGNLLSNMEARLVLDDGADAEVGEEGEVWFRGPNLMKGYLNNPTATREAITPDGWFNTGDTAIIDEHGDIYIVDRKKELIKYKGFQVSPAELEGKLLTHPKIVDACVIGVYSDAEATELSRAYVVPRGEAASLKTIADKEAFCEEIQTWFEGQVAKHKYLRGGVVVIDVIPKSAAGKILRKDLKELAKKSSAAEPKGKL